MPATLGATATTGHDAACCWVVTQRLLFLSSILAPLSSSHTPKNNADSGSPPSPFWSLHTASRWLTHYFASVHARMKPQLVILVCSAKGATNTWADGGERPGLHLEGIFTASNAIDAV
ncbi:hypothetical protein CLAIMM_01055 [Cladophialophora immunda]|nr:hypothetical protein CLAIMM_01055 [Cladophialophora immunda]